MTIEITKKNRRVTLADVARETGLSQATVSTVLNSHDGQCPIALKTQDIVLKAAKKLGYRASWRARALAKQQTGTVGLLYAGESPFTTGFNQSLLESLAARLCKHDYHQLFIPILEDHANYQDIINSDRIDGCLVLAPIPANLDVIRESGLPTVLVNVESELPFTQVLPDDYDGAVRITRHLLELGHQRIAMVMSAETHWHMSQNKRRAGFQYAMSQAGMAQHVQVLREESAIAALKNTDAAANRPTAMIAYEHHVAARLLQAAWSAGLKVPDDLSLASFNDVEFLRYTTPPMTTVALPAQEIAFSAADELIRQIHSKGTSSQRIVFGEQLVIRGSTGHPRKT